MRAQQTAVRALQRLLSRQQHHLGEAFTQKCDGSVCSQLAAAATSSSSSSSSSGSRCLFSARDTASSGSAVKGFRRVNPSSASADGSAAADAAASTSGQAGGSASLMEMSSEVPGGSKPLRTWERWYWGLGVAGVAALLYSRLKTPDKTPEELAEEQRKIEELRARRKDHIRAVLMSQNFLEGDSDPLDGLSPAQIVMFMEKYSIDPSDPLEGLTPEEIDAYMQQQEAKKEQQEQEQQ